jgi:hypothetical protein
MPDGVARNASPMLAVMDSAEAVNAADAVLLG